MPDMNKVEIVIDNERYSVFTDEDMEYIKKVENLINTQVEYFKNSNKRFNSHTSVIFTSFVLADKYLKSIRQLGEIENKIKKDFKTTDEENEKLKEQIEKIKKHFKTTDEENEKFKKQLEKIQKEYSSVCEEKEKYLEELLIKNNETELFEETIKKYKHILDERSKEIIQNKIIIEELKKKNKELEDLLDIETSS